MAFHGRLALIAGGASGMGRLMARRLAAIGAQVAILDVNEPVFAGSEQVLAGIRFFECDVTSLATVQAVVERVEREMGPIDRVAASAGIMPAGSISEMSAEQFHAVMRVNYEGLVNVVKSALPYMQARQRGEVIVFGSLAGVAFTQRFAAYQASKAAVNAFGEVLAQELKGSGIRVLTVRPGAVNTPMIQQATGPGGLDWSRKISESGRMATPEQILDAIDRGLEGDGDVLYPNAESWVGQVLRRISPRLTWKLANTLLK